MFTSSFGSFVPMFPSYSSPSSMPIISLSHCIYAIDMESISVTTRIEKFTRWHDSITLGELKACYNVVISDFCMHYGFKFTNALLLSR